MFGDNPNLDRCVPPTKKKNTITSHFSKTISHSEFQKRFVMAMVEGNIPPSFLANDELVALFTDINWSLPSRWRFWEIHQENASQVASLVSTVISDVHHTSISSDGLSSISNVSFNALVVHVITADWKIIPFCCGVARFDKSDNRRQTATELAKDLLAVADRFPKNKQGKSVIEMSSTFVADGTNLMPATAVRLNKEPIHCVSHLANLALRDLITSNVRLCVLCGVTSKLVKHFKKSTFAKDNLNTTCAFVLYTKTRFYSFLDMIDSVLINLPEIERYVPPTEKVPLAKSDMLDLKQDAVHIVQIMQPWKTAFTILGADLSPTSNKAILYFITLKIGLQQMESQNPFAKDMIQILERRFDKIVQSPIFLLANILDPMIRSITTN